MIQSLQQSVQSVINDGRIGNPVFLRCMVQTPIEETNVVSGIAALTEIANSWMPSAAEQIYALGGADTTQITAMVQYAGGQTALLSVNCIPANGEASVDLRLVGNKGVIYHETPVDQHRLINAPLVFKGGERLIDSIRQGLETGKPVKMMEG